MIVPFRFKKIIDQFNSRFFEIIKIIKLQGLFISDCIFTAKTHILTVLISF